MTTNEELCTDKEHALLLKETGLMKDVTNDGAWIYRYMMDGSKSTEVSFATRGYLKENNFDLVAEAYRLDKLLAKLPEWCSEAAETMMFNELAGDTIIDNYGQPLKMVNLMRKVVSKRGQAAANAAAKLLHLLWKEGLV